jgi:Flp pilus assembly protein CpaB
MKRLITTAILCAACVIASVALYTCVTRGAFAEIALSPQVATVVPAVPITAAQITQVNIRFYDDGKTLTSCSAFVEWRKGSVVDGQFSEVHRDNCTLTAQEVAAVLLAAQTVTPTEHLLGAEHPTPMDQILPALVALLKTPNPTTGKPRM